MAEEIALHFTAKDDASKVADALQKKVDKLDGETAEVELKTDDKKAKQSIDDFIKKLDKVDGETATAALALKGANIQTQLGDVLQEIAKVDASDATIDVKLAEAADLKGDLDTIEAKIKEINATPVDIDTKPAAEGLKSVHTEADQTKSVLANTVGNATQDLGALGGVAGTAGVTIGQLGEYAAEGNISLSGLAAAAGPMAGVLVVSQALSAAMKVFADRAKQSEEDTAAWTKAMGEGGDAAANMANDLKTTGKVMADISDHSVTLDKTIGVVKDEMFSLGGVAKDTWKLLSGGFNPVKNVTELLATAGITVAQYTTAVSGGADGLDTFTKAVRATNLSTEEQNKLINAVTNGQKDYAQAQKNSAAANKVFASTATDASKGLGGLNDNLSAVAQADKEGIDLTDAYAKSLEEQGKKSDQAAQGAKDFADAVNSIDFKNADIAGAAQAMSDFHDAQFGATDAIIGIESAVDNFSQALADSHENMKKTAFNFDLSTEAGRKNQQAMEDVASAIDVQLGQALADSHGDFKTFEANAKTITDQSLEELKKKFHLTDGQVEDLRTHLGLTAQDWKARFDMAGLDSAQTKVALLQGAITGITDPLWTAKIVTQISAGDFVGVVGTVQAYYRQNEPTLKTKLEPPPKEELDGALRQLQNQANLHPVTIPTQIGTPNKNVKDAGGVIGPEGGIAGERRSEILDGRWITTGPTPVPPGTRVTSGRRTAVWLRQQGLKGYDYRRPKLPPGYDRGTTGAPTPIGALTTNNGITVNVNAAVIGNRFDVMRAVRRATYEGTRLLGSRN